MALDLAPSNFAGLAALASGGSGNLNLTVPGALGLQGLQINNQNAASVRDAAIQQMQIRQQAETALRQQQIARQELAQQGQYQQGLLGQAARGQDIQQQGQMLDADQNAAQLGFQQQQLAQQGALGQGQLDVEKQKLAQDLMAKEMAKLLDEKKEKLEEKGAYVASGLLAIKQAKTPEEAQTVRNEIVDTAVVNKYITGEQAKALRKAPLSQFVNFLTQQAMTLDAVKNYKDMVDANKEQKGGKNRVTLPDGTVIESDTTNPTTANITKLQEESLEADTTLKQIEPYSNPPENFFGLTSLKHMGTKARELGKTIPGVSPDKKDVDEMAQFSEYNANAKLNIMKTAKTLAGARFSDADLKMIEQIMPKVGLGETKAEYLKKFNLVKNFLSQIKNTRDEILKTGKYKLGTEEYNQEFSNKLPDILDKTITEPDYSKMTTEELIAEKQRLLRAK